MPEEFEIRDAVLIKYNGKSAAVTIPDGVRKIERRAFRGCKQLLSVTIPEGVTTIGDLAFEECTGLTAVTLPHSVTRLGSYPFYACAGLTSVTIRDIRFDAAALREQQEKWDYYPWEVINILIMSLPVFSFCLPFAEQKYPVAWTAFCLCPTDMENTAYVRMHLEDMLRFLIRHNDARTLQTALESGMLDDLLPNCIDTCISYAIEQQSLETQLLLTNYKHEHIGYTDAADQFTL
ncbi:MAG: leucine-rich repeat domain-containing protein [Oscillospiraceae bacterium]|nr:leucine-rich repeat domain-containing protein [Oscillospiraceae bacterium]